MMMAKTSLTLMAESITELFLEPLSSVAKRREGKAFPYRSVTGSLFCFSTHTRRDITFSLDIINRLVASRPLCIGWLRSACLVIYKECRKSWSPLVLLHPDQGCKMAIFQGCQHITTVIGLRISRSGSPQEVIWFNTMVDWSPVFR